MEAPVPQSPGEPLRPIALIVAAILGIIALLTAFGVELTNEQTAAIVGIPATVGPFVVWLVGRLKTTPTDNVAAVIDKSGDLVAASAAALPNGMPVRITADPAQVHAPGGNR